MADVPTRRSKSAAPRRNVLRKAADSDVHPAEPRTGASHAAGRASSSGASSAAARATGRATGSGGARTERG